ncbi:hypothetical protein AURDEDRAFT_131621 [Auricularia subglabra TFB-10046 SS5]|uniref:Uncharacterized protein n=1 Tax=Auricularia subglabra (strain TFB-10046 / SS5) TaxID=717982 RepID=J0LAW2_AURST|nr:hypothetical protein AURDEDRAFT_131621 [Auricularia subglabra TFB-10046 SS5]
MTTTPKPSRISLPFIADAGKLADYISVASEEYPGVELLLLPNNAGTEQHEQAAAHDMSVESPRSSGSLASPVPSMDPAQPPVTSESESQPGGAEPQGVVTIFDEIQLPPSFKTVGMADNICTLADQMCKAWQSTDGPNLEEWLATSKTLVTAAERIFSETPDAWPVDQRHRFDALCGLIKDEDTVWEPPKSLQKRLKRWGWVRSSLPYSQRQAVRDAAPYLPANKACDGCLKGHIKACVIRPGGDRCFVCAKQKSKCLPPCGDDDEGSSAAPDTPIAHTEAPTAGAKRKQEGGDNEGIDVRKRPRLQSEAPVKDRKKTEAILDRCESAIDELRRVDRLPVYNPHLRVVR